MYGDGRTQSIIKSSIEGDAFRSNSPINGSTKVNLVIADLGGLYNTNSKNSGAGITDVAGNFLHKVLLSPNQAWHGKTRKNYRCGMMDGANAEQNKTVWFKLSHTVFATFYKTNPRLHVEG